MDTSPTPEIDIDALREAVMREHNLLLHKDDPIFVSVLLNKQLLQWHFDRIVEHVAQFEQKNAGLLVQQVEEVKRAAEALIGGSSKYFSEAVSAAVPGIADGISERIEERMQRATTAAARAERAQFWSVLAAAVAAGAGLLLIGFGLGQV